MLFLTPHMSLSSLSHENMQKMKVEVQSRKMVKPCIPTHFHRRRYQISLLDELNPTMNVFRILYYQPNSKTINLEPSLAQILPDFYPLAGRYIKEDHAVDCNDAGAEFIEARVDWELRRLINDSELPVSHFNDLLPVNFGAADEPTDPMLAVQINHFRCGGIAIGVCASHRVFDACSLSILLTAWANAAATGKSSIKPDFNSGALFPPENIPPLDFGDSTGRNENIVGKRIVFDKHEISRLRERANFNEGGRVGRPPSRVVVVSAVLAQAFLRADRVRRGGAKPGPSMIVQSINVRERTVPPVHKHACGTWVSISHSEHAPEKSWILEHDFPTVVRIMREVTARGVADCTRILCDEEFARWTFVDIYDEISKKVLGGDCKLVNITDLSKFGDYGLDFGFGEPVWVSLADVPIRDLFILMNTKENDGIEAWVYLDESDMPYFEQDCDIKKLSGSGRIRSRI